MKKGSIRLIALLALVALFAGTLLAPRISVALMANGGGTSATGTAAPTASPFSVNGSPVPGTASPGSYLIAGPGGSPSWAPTPIAGATAFPGPSVAGRTVDSSASATSKVVTVPSTQQNGSLLAMYVQVATAGTPCPAGWTQKAATGQINSSANFAFLCTVAEGATIIPTPTVTDVTGVKAWEVLDLHKPTGAVAVDQAAGMANAGGYCATPSAIPTPTQNNSLVVYFAASGSSAQAISEMAPNIASNTSPAVLNRTFSEDGILSGLGAQNSIQAWAYQLITAGPVPVTPICNSSASSSNALGTASFNAF